jgi:hypothetical protein
MRSFLSKAVLLTCLACTVVAQDSVDELTVQRLLQRYTENYGGLREVNRLASLSIEGVQIQDGVSYSFHIRKKRPNSIRYQIERDETTLTSIFNGEQGWLQTEQGGESSVEELTGARLKALREESRFESPLYRHEEKPENEIRLEGREQIGSEHVYVLTVKTPGELPRRYFLHPQNAHVLRVDRLNEKGEVVLQTLYRNYKKVDGHPFAHEIENRANGETLSITRIESISVNPGLLSFYFENPES